jgi:hypothetical protein
MWKSSLLWVKLGRALSEHNSSVDPTSAGLTERRLRGKVPCRSKKAANAQPSTSRPRSTPSVSVSSWSGSPGAT